MIGHADKVKKKSIKLLVYGDSNTGKTDYSLRTTPRPILVFDTERGTDLFEGRKGFEFDYWLDEKGNKTASIRELKRCIEYLKTEEGQKIKTFVLDNATDIWENIQFQRSDYKDAVAKKKGKNLDTRNESELEVFNQRDWGDCKKIYKELMLELKNLSQNVIIIAAEKEISETKADGTIVRTGEYTYDAEKNTKRGVDFSMRLTYDEKTKKRIAHIVKSRGEYVESFAKIENPTFDIFSKTIEEMEKGEGESHKISPDKAEHLFDNDPLLETKEKSVELVKKLGGSKNEKVVKLFEELKIEMTPKGVNSIKESDVVKKLLTDLEEIEKENK